MFINQRSRDRWKNVSMHSQWKSANAIGEMRWIVISKLCEHSTHLKTYWHSSTVSTKTSTKKLWIFCRGRNWFRWVWMIWTRVFKTSKSKKNSWKLLRTLGDLFFSFFLTESVAKSVKFFPIFFFRLWKSSTRNTQHSREKTHPTFEAVAKSIWSFYENRRKRLLSWLQHVLIACLAMQTLASYRQKFSCIDESVEKC